MAGDTYRRARGALAVAIAGCCVFALQSLPTASAARNAGSPATDAGAGGAAATRRAERAAAKSEGLPPPLAPLQPAPAAPPAAAAHGHRAQPPQPGDSSAGQIAGARPRKGERPAGRAPAQRRDGRGQERTASSPAAAGASPDKRSTEQSSSAQADALSSKQLSHQQNNGTGGGQHGSKDRKHKGAGEPPAEEGSGAQESSSAGSSGASGKGERKGNGGLSSGASVAQASVAAASVALPAVASANGIGSASVSSLAPSAKAAPGAGVVAGRSHHHAARRGRKGHPGTSSAAASGTASSLLGAPTAADTGPPSSATHSAAKRSKRRQSTQPALVKTFTRIVGVVPTPVRILIGGLILLALMLGVRSLLSGVRTRRLVRQRGQLLEDVGLLQTALLPVPPARLGPVATSAAYRPADGPGAGGDFYDVFALEDGEIAVIVGDVSGHGREALPHTALLRFTVRAYLEAGLSPRKALQTAGSVLERQLAGSFATVIAATYNPRERKLTYASAGHPPPVVLGEEDAEGAAGSGDAARPRLLVPVTSCSAPPIGAGMLTGTRQTVISVPGPARVCLHTDGVTEARIAGSLYGAERLAAALADLHPDASASALLDRVAEQTDARPDDMAACLLRVHGGRGAPTLALEQLELNREAVSGTRVVRFLLDCGIERDEGASLLQAARQRLRHADSVMLELVPGADGRPLASLVEDNPIHPAALATAGAS